MPVVPPETLVTVPPPPPPLLPPPTLPDVGGNCVCAEAKAAANSNARAAKLFFISSPISAHHRRNGRRCRFAIPRLEHAYLPCKPVEGVRRGRLVNDWNALMRPACRHRRVMAAIDIVGSVQVHNRDKPGGARSGHARRVAAHFCRNGR